MTIGRRWSLVVLIGVVVLIVMLAIRWEVDSQAGSAATPSNAAGRAAGAGTREAEGVDVRLERLEADRDALTEAGRNPFRFGASPPPPRAVRQEEPDGPPTFIPPPAVPAGPAPTPPIPLKYIGYVAAQDGARTASFSDGRGNVFQGREDDIIEGRYKVVRVDTDSVELAYLDGRGRQTIRLSGQ